MATAPTPNPVPVTLTVLDPLSADAQAILAAYTATCTLYTTPAGQKLLEAEISLGNTIEGALSKFFANGWNGIVGLFKKL